MGFLGRVMVMEWPSKPGAPPTAPYEAACVALGALSVAVPIGIGAFLNNVPAAFWVWLGAGVVLAGGFYGLAWILARPPVWHSEMHSPPPVADDWQPAFTEEEYAAMRQQVPFIGILDSGGPGLSRDSEQVDEILYGKTPSAPPAFPYVSGAAAASAIAAANPGRRAPRRAGTSRQ